MISFSDAKSQGANDKQIELKHNQFVDLVSTYLSRGYLESLYGSSSLDLESGELSINSILDGQNITIRLNVEEGLAFYQEDVYRGGLAIVNDELSLVTDVLKSPDINGAFIKFDTYEYSGGISSRINFYVNDLITPSDTPLEMMRIYGGYIESGGTGNILDTGINSAATATDDTVNFKIQSAAGTAVSELLLSSSTTNSFLTLQLLWDYLNGSHMALYRTNFRAGDVDYEWLIADATGLTTNGNTVWHAGNDGTGSGLDADKLDGNEATAFYPVIAHYHSTEDPNTTEESHLLTQHANCPTTAFYYILTFFYSTKTGNRAQLAIKYNASNAVYVRYYSTSTWSTWTKLVNADGDTLSGDMTLSDGVDLILGSTTGTKIGTSATQKLGFFGATPIVQGTAFTQTYSTYSHTHAAMTAAALTNNTLETPTHTLARQGSTYSQVTINQAISSLCDAIEEVRADQLNTAKCLNALIDDLQALGLV